MGFAFRYKALLGYRENLKEQAEIALSVAQKELKEARESLENTRTKRRDAVKAFESRLKNRISADEIRNYRDYLTGLDARIDSQARTVEGKEETVRSRMEQVLTRSREYKIIEKLREKDFKKWQVQQLREEQKWMSEVAVTRHGKEYT